MFEKSAYSLIPQCGGVVAPTEMHRVSFGVVNFEKKYLHHNAIDIYLFIYLYIYNVSGGEFLALFSYQ
jgi:hypothetical protein